MTLVCPSLWLQYLLKLHPILTTILTAIIIRNIFWNTYCLLVTAITDQCITDIPVSLSDNTFMKYPFYLINSLKFSLHFVLHHSVLFLSLNFENLISLFTLLFNFLNWFTICIWFLFEKFYRKESKYLISSSWSLLINASNKLSHYNYFFFLSAISAFQRRTSDFYSQKYVFIFPRMKIWFK